MHNFLPKSTPHHCCNGRLQRSSWPLYALGLIHSTLLAAAQNLSRVCQPPLAAGFIYDYDCYLKHAEFVAED